MTSTESDIVKCPSCNKCVYDYWLCKGPYDIGGSSVTVCLSCDMHAFYEGELPRSSRCKSDQGICSCNNDYLRSKGILLDDDSIKHGYCHECFGKLVPIGSARDGGAPHDDWPDRKYHKKCWKMLQEE